MAAPLPGETRRLPLHRDQTGACESSRSRDSSETTVLNGLAASAWAGGEPSLRLAWQTSRMHAMRRPLGIGPRPAVEQSPLVDSRGGTVAERAAVEPLAPAVEGGVVPVLASGRRPLGAGGAGSS